MTDQPTVRHARREAEAVAGRAARVLEPSPPAVHDGPFFADDPTALDGDADAVTPTSAGTTSWDDLAANSPDIAAFARAHWLGAHSPLPPVPHDYVARRDDLHRLAYAVVAEARRAATTKFGLRFTRGGLGTPFFGDDVQVRVESGLLVVQERDQVRWQPITSLADAGRFVGVTPGTEAAEHDSPTLGDLDAPLRIDAELTDFMGSWFGFATSVLEELRLTDGAVDVSRVQVWPGHLDAAIEMGDDDAGARATYGASPGDGGHDQPYLYVGPWGAVDGDDPFWNDEHFTGASLGYRELRAADDARTTALEFYRAAHTRLT